MLVYCMCQVLSHAYVCQGGLRQLRLVEVPCRRHVGVLPAQLQLCEAATLYDRCC